MNSYTEIIKQMLALSNDERLTEDERKVLLDGATKFTMLLPTPQRAHLAKRNANGKKEKFAGSGF